MPFKENLYNKTILCDFLLSPLSSIDLICNEVYCVYCSTSSILGNFKIIFLVSISRTHFVDDDVYAIALKGSSILSNRKLK